MVKFSSLYRLVRILGAGGYGIVAEVVCLQTERRLALKITSYSPNHISSGARSLLNEYKLLTEELSHPNIIKVFRRSLEQNYSNYIIMEMELGLETLRSYAARVHLSEEQASAAMRGIFSALEYLHNTNNVIHRDIKPENIVIMDYEDLSSVKLIDFGLAVHANGVQQVSDFAKCGTLLYVPPEQISKNFAYAKKADMWAAGIITH